MTFSEFEQSFNWHRNLSLELLKQFPQEQLTDKLSPRSLPINIQFIDLGDMELRVVKQMNGKVLDLSEPSKNCVNKQEILKYLHEAHKVAFNELKNMDPNTTRLDWFGRMNFSYSEALHFLLAHEVMHHGEIMSYICVKNLPMPNSLRETWGFE